MLISPFQLFFFCSCNVQLSTSMGLVILYPEILASLRLSLLGRMQDGMETALFAHCIDLRVQVHRRAAPRS
ncbi:hypothetical protein B0O80DRAFT_439711 [Mortierella sp. GBAus27b]|nr:hypothetical protein B0O80DRAFT_439711 [Mortierella sp. GBAus27b]